MPVKNNRDKSKMNLVVSLKIGTATACAVVDKHSECRIELSGSENIMPAEIQRELDTKLKKATNVIFEAISEAENLISCRIESVIQGISGQNIKVWNCSGVTAIKQIKVSKEDVSRAIDAARANLSPSLEVLHILPLEFIVDDQDGIIDPIGMTGIRLEIRTHLVSSFHEV